MILTFSSGIVVLPYPGIRAPPCPGIGTPMPWDWGTPFHVNGTSLYPNPGTSPFHGNETSLHPRTVAPLGCGIRAPSYPGNGTALYPENRAPHTMAIGQPHIPEIPISWHCGTPILQDQGTPFHGTGTPPHPWSTPRPWNWCAPRPQECDTSVSWGMEKGNTLELGYPQTMGAGYSHISVPPLTLELRYPCAMGRGHPNIPKIPLPWDGVTSILWDQSLSTL